MLHGKEHDALALHNTKHNELPNRTGTDAQRELISLTVQGPEAGQDVGQTCRLTGQTNHSWSSQLHGGIG